MPWAVSGMSTTLRLAAAVFVVGAHEQQAGELAVGAGRRLQRGAREAGDLGQPALSVSISSSAPWTSSSGS